MKCVILGGTGTLGKALTRELVKDPKNEILIISRGELKQKEMANEFREHPQVSFSLGDIRDSRTCYYSMRDRDTVFHVAALKHVEVLEDNPEESVKTNIQGTINVADNAIRAGVKHVVFSSTDKAVDPINVYGMCKGISERILLRRNETQAITRFSVYRWGNVIGSSGSVIPIFAKAIKEGRPIEITDKYMSRFWIKIEDAVNFILNTYRIDDGKQVLFPAIGSARLTKIIDVLSDLAGKKPVLKEVGIRKGEKLHESLTSLYDETNINSSGEYDYTQSELKSLLKEFV